MRLRFPERTDQTLATATYRPTGGSHTGTSSTIWATPKGKDWTMTAACSGPDRRAVMRYRVLDAEPGLDDAKRQLESGEVGCDGEPLEVSGGDGNDHPLQVVILPGTAVTAGYAMINRA